MGGKLNNSLHCFGYLEVNICLFLLNSANVAVSFTITEDKWIDVCLKPI